MADASEGNRMADEVEGEDTCPPTDEQSRNREIIPVRFLKSMAKG